MVGGHDVWASHPRRCERNITKLMTKSMYTSQLLYGKCLLLLQFVRYAFMFVLVAVVSQRSAAHASVACVPAGPLCDG